MTQAETRQQVLIDKTMTVAAVCLGKVEFLPGAGLDGKDLTTAFLKKPVEGTVEVDSSGLVGDEAANSQSHGGMSQAVCVYCGEDYKWWEGELGRTLPPGSFGENLIINGIKTKDIMYGDTISFPSLTLSVTSPRVPCGKLAAFMGDKLFPRKFMKSGRTGFYCCVLEPGSVTARDKVKIDRRVGAKISVSDMLGTNRA